MQQTVAGCWCQLQQRQILWFRSPDTKLSITNLYPLHAVQVSEAASLIAAAAAEAPTRPGLSSAAAAAAKDKANQLIAELYNGLGLAEAVPGAFGGEGQNGRPKGKDKTKGKYARGVRAWAGGFNVTGCACCGRLRVVEQVCADVSWPLSTLSLNTLCVTHRRQGEGHAPAAPGSRGSRATQAIKAPGNCH